MINFGSSISAEGLTSLRLTDFRYGESKCAAIFQFGMVSLAPIIGTLPAIE